MLKTILLCLTALAIISRADKAAIDNCFNEIRSSSGIINQFNQDLTSKNLPQIRNDFTSLQTLVESINKLCYPMVHLAGSIDSPELTNCDAVVEELRNKVQDYVKKDTYDFDKIQILGYLISKAALFSKMCPPAEQKPETFMKRILGNMNISPIEDLQEKVQASTPECLSQVYQSLTTLYDFEADASDQDISDMEADFKALIGVSNDLNDFCLPKIVVNVTAPSDSKDCDTAFQNIGDILIQFGNSDPSNATNAIETIQDLWNEYPSFKQNCVAKKQAENMIQGVEEELEAKSCKSYYFEALEKLAIIMWEGSSYEVKKLLEHVKEFGLTLEEINQHCKPEFQIDLLNVGNLEEKCLENLAEIRNAVIGVTDIRELKDLKSVMEKVWGLSKSVAKGC